MELPYDWLMFHYFDTLPGAVALIEAPHRAVVAGVGARQQADRARVLAMEEIKTAAAELGANAVVAIDIDYETVGGNGSMLMVTVSGTAVVIQ